MPWKSSAHEERREDQGVRVLHLPGCPANSTCLASHLVAVLLCTPRASYSDLDSTGGHKEVSDELSGDNAGDQRQGLTGELLPL